jgi:hypothetical protein
MRRWTIALAVVLILARAACAAPLDLKQVPADAAWVAHLDVDAMRTSTVLQRAYRKYIQPQKKAQRQLDNLRDRTGMDPRKDLHGLTAYGKRIGRNEGVLIVQAEVNQKLLLALVKLTPDHRSVGYGPYEIHTWTDAKGKKDQRTVSGAFYKPMVIVLAPSADEVKAALDVLDGKSPSLAGKPSPLAAPVPAGTAVMARAVGLAHAELPFKSPLVTQSETFSLVVGEHQAECFAEAKLATRSPELAAQVKAIAEGARAMAELQRSGEPATVNLIRRLQVKVTGKTVSVEFHAPADEVWTEVDKNWKRLVPAPKAGVLRSGGPAN